MPACSNQLPQKMNRSIQIAIDCGCWRRCAMPRGSKIKHQKTKERNENSQTNAPESKTTRSNQTPPKAKPPNKKTTKSSGRAHIRNGYSEERKPERTGYIPRGGNPKPRAYSISGVPSWRQLSMRTSPHNLVRLPLVLVSSGGWPIINRWTA